VKGLGKWPLIWMVLLALWALATRAGGAAVYYFSPDSAATLGGTIWTPNQFGLNNNGIYSKEETFGEEITFKSLHRKSDGAWLFSLGSPVLVAPAFEARTRDVIYYDYISIYKYLDGAAAGIPDDAGIDALFLVGADAVVSFDVPTNVGGTEYSPSDLVRFTGNTPSLYWDAEPAGVPAYANLVGADRDPLTGRLVVTFDVPVNLGGTEFLPGQLVQWTGSGFASLYADPAWPATAQLRDFSFVPAAGRVPGDLAGETPLTVSRNAATHEVTLAWVSSCGEADDYEIYQGTLDGTPGFYNHAPVFCGTAGLTSMTFSEPAQNVYWLIVPRNSLAEGSYGKRTGGAEIPQGAGACLVQQVSACP